MPSFFAKDVNRSIRWAPPRTGWLARFCRGAPLLYLCCVNAAFAQPLSGTAQVRHAPAVNGRVEGSLQQMTAENTTMNGGASVTGNLLVPGTPSVRLNGTPTYGGTLDGTGSAIPANHKITLNGSASLGHVIRRTDAIIFPTVALPPLPAGTRTVTLTHSGQSPGDFTTLKNLTLTGSTGPIVVPPGTYGDFTANDNNSFVLGVAGATAPAVYNFQHLTLNGSSHLDVVGPVIVTLAADVSANGNLGDAAHPSWLTLKLAGGSLTLNGHVSVYGYVTAPSGTVTLNGSSQLVGGLVADQLTINGSGLLRLLAPPSANLPPTVSLTAPLNGANYTAPAAYTLAATAADPDGSVAKVEFYQAATKLGEALSAPYTLPLTLVPAGSFTYTARAIDNLGATTDSAAVSITVSSPNQPPTVTLSAPVDGSLHTAPATLTLAADAADADGSVFKVEFYQGTTKLGESFAAPFAFTLTLTFPGTYPFSAKAYDNLNAVAPSPTVTVTVVAPNQSPTVALTAPLDSAAFNAPAAFLLMATAADPDGIVAKVEFFQGTVKLAEDAFAPFEFAVSGLAAGSYNYLARATDNTGSATDSAPITITVVSPNVPPTVDLTAPANGAGYTEPATFTLAATATDSDGTVTKVEFFNGGTKLGAALAAPYEFNWTGVAAGSYALTAVATDNTGATTASAVHTVTVAANRLPFLTNFEPAEGYQPGPLDGQKGWTVLGAASVVTAPVYGGQQAVSVAPATPPALLTRAFVNSDPRVTFVDLFVRPAAAPTAAAGVFFETDAVQVALTGISPTGLLQAFNGDGAGGGTWLSTRQGPVLAASGQASDWLRLTARSDYSSKKWDLYFNGQMIAADLGFSNNAPAAFTGLGLSGHPTLTTNFDDLLIAFENPLFIDADHDGMDDTWESAHGLNPALNDRAGDLDADGLTNIQEYAAGSNPVDFYNGRAFALSTIVSSGSSPIAYSYDASGRVILADYSGGQLIQFAHSAASNLTAVTSTGIGSGNIVAWRTAYGLPADGSGNGADTAILANDGLPNLAKYAFGLAPNVTAVGEYPSVKLTNFSSSDYLTLTYVRPEPTLSDLTYVVQVSGNGGTTWTSDSGATVNVSTTISNGIATVIVRDATPVASPSFGRRIRLMIERRAQP